MISNIIFCIVCTNFMIAFSEMRLSCNSPIYCYGRLLNTVQRAGIFDDSKQFVDMKQVYNTSQTLQNFELLLKSSNNHPSKEHLADFISTNFVEGNELEYYSLPDWKRDPKFLQRISEPSVKAFATKLVSLWQELSRTTKPEVFENVDHYSYIPVPNAFVIPGGRFREYYYWDSLWIIEGLLVSEMAETAKNMIENFIHLVKKFGFVPNGGRIYYLGRSQPPLLTTMTYAYFKHTRNISWIKENINNLETELTFWLRHRSTLIAKGSRKYLVFHYNAPTFGPRPESYVEDVNIASVCTSDSEKQEVYTDLKSAAESGWDFSSRWLVGNSGEVSANLTQINTRRIVPVDLNSYLCRAFKELSLLYLELGDITNYWGWRNFAIKLETSIEKVFWDDIEGVWFDYDQKLSQLRKTFYPSNLTPLWASCYGRHKNGDTIGKNVVAYLQREGVLTYTGGVPTSTKKTGQQWDFPNAWPPLQDIVVQALLNSGNRVAVNIARQIAIQWVQANIKGYEESGAMFEKYDAVTPGKYGAGGEYEVQSGFGWTNGVALKFINQFYT